MSPTIEVLARADAVARRHTVGGRTIESVRPLSCSIINADRIALVGPSGSGKSSLLHLLAGLDDPTEGEVSWPGIGARRELRPGPVAVVFQAPSLVPSLTALENVALVALLAGATPDDARSQALQTLHTLGIEVLADRLPEELSAGQAQRVAVARCLLGRPRLILADEPTGQLDSVAAAQVADALIHAADQAGAALLIATHDPAIADRLAQRWTMQDGRLVHGRTP